MSDFHNRKRVKTRKLHYCEGCLEDIPIGNEATNCSGVFQGDFYNYYMCDPCVDWFDQHEVDEFTAGEIGEFRAAEEIDSSAEGHQPTESA